MYGHTAAAGSVFTTATQNNTVVIFIPVDKAAVVRSQPVFFNFHVCAVTSNPDISKWSHSMVGLITPKKNLNEGRNAARPLCSLMMYETASPLEYHRNTTVEQQHCPIMETDGTAPALFTLSTTKIELAWHSRLRQGPRKRGLNLTAAHVCQSHWILPCPDSPAAVEEICCPRRT
ncbi:hypothetical protein INR49_003731 [Caranx melampygus]|nr:hypothetical protein INR49_003731 [Caranx melampygus]